MIKFEVGKKFPLPLPLEAQAGEVVKPSIVRASFDIVYWIDNPSDSDIQTWRKGAFKYGVFVRHSIPFFWIDFGAGWDFDLSFNILKQKPAEQETFVNEEGNLINLFLINRRSNILLGMRAVGIDLKVANAIKQVCREQIEKYKSVQEVDDVINQLLTQYDTRAMVGQPSWFGRVR